MDPLDDNEPYPENSVILPPVNKEDAPDDKTIDPPDPIFPDPTLI